MTFLLAVWLLVQGGVWTAEEHKAAMDDASDLQEDLRDAIGAKSSAQVAEAAVKLEALMGRTEDYWNAKKQADIIKLAQATRALTKQLAADGKAGRFDQAGETFQKMSTSCNTCHDLHPENR